MTKYTLRVDIITSTGDVTTKLCGDVGAADAVVLDHGTLLVSEYDDTKHSVRTSGWAPGCWFKYVVERIALVETSASEDAGLPNVS